MMRMMMVMKRRQSWELSVCGCVAFTLGAGRTPLPHTHCIHVLPRPGKHLHVVNQSASQIWRTHCAWVRPSGLWPWISRIHEMDSLTFICRTDFYVISCAISSHDSLASKWAFCVLTTLIRCSHGLDWILILKWIEGSPPLLCWVTADISVVLLLNCSFSYLVK